MCIVLSFCMLLRHFTWLLPCAVGSSVNLSCSQSSCWCFYVVRLVAGSEWCCLWFFRTFLVSALSLFRRHLNSSFYGRVGVYRGLTGCQNGSILSLVVREVCASSIESIPPHPTSRRSILILSSHLHLRISSGLFPSGFTTKSLYTPLPSHYAPHTQPISFPILSPEQHWVSRTDH